MSEAERNSMIGHQKSALQQLADDIIAEPPPQRASTTQVPRISPDESAKQPSSNSSANRLPIRGTGSLRGSADDRIRSNPETVTQSVGGHHHRRLGPAYPDSSVDPSVSSAPSTPVSTQELLNSSAASSPIMDVHASLLDASRLSIPPPSDMPPLDAEVPNVFLKLQQKRLHNERIFKNLKDEEEKANKLVDEEAKLVLRIEKSKEVIQALNDKALRLEKEYKAMNELYLTNSEQLKILQKAVAGIAEQWQKDSAQFNSYSSQLTKLRAQVPSLTKELTQTAALVTDLSSKATQKIREKENLAQQIRIQESEKSKLEKERKCADIGVQTNCDFAVLEEIKLIRNQLENQVSAMKHVRETIDVVRRCC